MTKFLLVLWIVIADQPTLQSGLFASADDCHRVGRAFEHQVTLYPHGYACLEVRP